jgi:imidazolonepropionase-like amidohydrolase
MRDPLVLEDVVVLDGTGGPPTPHARVVVDDGVIASVGAAGAPIQGGSVVEGRGRWLLPGLWDTHIHYVLSAGGCVWPEEFSHQQLLSNLQAYLRNGITSVVSVGDPKDLVLAARASERDGRLRAPRIVAAGPTLTAPGGHPVATILHGEPGRFRNLAIEISGPAEGRRAVRQLVAGDGVDLLKVIYSTIPGNVPRLGRDTLDAVIDEAHVLRRRIVAHVATPAEAMDCIIGGVDGLEHMVIAAPQALEPVFSAAADHGVFWTPTLSLFDKMAHDGDERYVAGYRPEGSVTRTVLDSLRDPAAWWRKSEPGVPAPPWSRTVELTGQAHRTGVQLPLGTDSGNPAVFHGLAAHRELELLVRAGLTPLQALTAATAVAAAKVGAEDRLGTVQPGKEADLVVLGASPIEDIRNTRRVEMVVKRGELLNAAELAVV